MSDGHGEATALNVPWTPQPAVKPGYGPDPGCQPCPDCGGLECLCRPRFFAGQLLTEQDLNRLDHYIVEKNKLHNRHLVGWGVVCGLEVLCDQCDERVRVTPGYAISPCGEDIVVCKPDYVDICALIDRCRKIDEVDCRPYAGKDGCEDIEEEWVLAIRYLESPARGMTALTGAASCACAPASASSCGCGGSGGAGCSCAGTEAPAAKNGDAPRLRRGAPPSCEPTMVCESYRYEIFRNPEETEEEDGPRDNDSNWIIGSFAGVFERLDGDFARRVTCCLRDVEKALPKPPGSLNGQINADARQEWVGWACAAKRSLKLYYQRIGGNNCEVGAKLDAISVPPANMPIASFQQAMKTAATDLLWVALEATLHCICSNLLPPCPAPEDPRVPLAVVTVRRQGCDIVKVCNWTPLRRHVTTFRSLDYWFGWLPLRRLVRDAIESVCCNLLDLPDRVQPDATVPGGTATAVPVQEGPIAQDAVAGDDIAQSKRAKPAKAQATAQATADPLATPLTLRLGTRSRRTGVLSQAAIAGLAGDGPTAEDLFDVTFRRPVFATGDFADAEDQRRMSATLAESGLVRTFAGLIQATGLRERALGLAGVAGVAASRAGGGEMSELRARLDRQDAEIAELRRGLAGAAAPRDGKS